jgi:hypothetical protein
VIQKKLTEKFAGAEARIRLFWQLMEEFSIWADA